MQFLLVSAVILEQTIVLRHLFFLQGEYFYDTNK